MFLIYFLNILFQRYKFPFSIVLFRNSQIKIQKLDLSNCSIWWVYSESCIDKRNIHTLGRPSSALRLSWTCPNFRPCGPSDLFLCRGRRYINLQAKHSRVVVILEGTRGYSNLGGGASYSHNPDATRISTTRCQY